MLNKTFHHADHSYLNNNNNITKYPIKFQCRNLNLQEGPINVPGAAQTFPKNICEFATIVQGLFTCSLLFSVSMCSVSRSGEWSKTSSCSCLRSSSNSLRKTFIFLTYSSRCFISCAFWCFISWATPKTKWINHCSAAQLPTRKDKPCAVKLIDDRKKID